MHTDRFQSHALGYLKFARTRYKEKNKCQDKIIWYKWLYLSQKKQIEVRKNFKLAGHSKIHGNTGLKLMIMLPFFEKFFKIKTANINSSNFFRCCLLIMTFIIK